MLLRVFAFAAALSVPSAASAAHVLVVSDSTADTDMAVALEAAGHQVELVTSDFTSGNATLRGDLSRFDAVFWSASGYGSGDAHGDAGVFANLSAYVERGGRVLVTGYDSVASPTDPLLIAFLGGTGSTDVPPAPGPVTSASTSLTVGVEDIRSVTFAPACGDRDTLTGLSGDTIEVVGTPAGNGAQWTLRHLGAGEIAYVSNGDTSASAAGSWTEPAGVYHAALLNFASSARPFAHLVDVDAPVETTPPHARRARVSSLVEAERAAVLVGPDRAWVPEGSGAAVALCSSSRCRPILRTDTCAPPSCPGSGTLVIATEAVAGVSSFPTGRDEWYAEVQAVLMDTALRPLAPYVGSYPGGVGGSGDATFFRGHEDFGLEGSAFAGAGYLVDAAVGLPVMGASIGLRWTPRMNEPIRLLFGNILGLDARVTVLPNVTGQRPEDVGVLLGIAPMLAYGLPNERVRLPPTWAWLIPEVGAAFRPNQDPAAYFTWTLSLAVLADAHVGFDLRATATVIDAWNDGGDVEALFGTTLGLLFR